MIRGKVNADLQPFVSLELRTKSGEFERFDIKFDTGFNGELGLPNSILDMLQKTSSGEFITRFGNGQFAIVDAYDVEAIIDGQVQSLIAMDFGSDSQLLGMKALPKWTGCVEFKVNGDVTIQRPR